MHRLWGMYTLMAVHDGDVHFNRFIDLAINSHETLKIWLQAYSVARRYLWSRGRTSATSVNAPCLLFFPRFYLVQIN